MDTLGSHILALQVQGEGNPFAGSGDVITLIADTTPINQAVLAILLLFSVASWAIIIQKLRMFRVLERETARFLDVFRRASTFSAWSVESLVKITLRAASRSRFGVLTQGWPMTPKVSPRHWSAVINRTFLTAGFATVDAS